MLRHWQNVDHRALRNKLSKPRNQPQARHAEPHLVEHECLSTMSPCRLSISIIVNSREGCRSTEHKAMKVLHER